MSNTTGRVTLPSEANFLEETKEMMARWGADALRDSDGTELPEDVKQLDAKIYTTYFVARGHNEFAELHMDECQQLYLMSPRNTATGGALSIDVMEGYFAQQVRPDYEHDPAIWWEVMDRTANAPLPASDWTLDKAAGRVIIPNAAPFHEYTVSFLAWAVWDPTQMYNHITNSWGDKPHDIPFDVRRPASWQFAKEYLVQWLRENPLTDVVRFTTFFYHFTLVFNSEAKEKFVDWFGYGMSVSTQALLEFEREYGYRLRPEDLVDNGYYNTAFRVPTKRYLDYMDFIQRFVAARAKELVELVHAAGKEAVMFLGDNWIGTEPYGKYFGEIGLDAVVGSVGGGATLRMISEIPHVKYTEGRFLPYFFPDTFYDGNDPCPETVANWLTARRAIMRKPVDRIGYGGYLSLVYRFPKFVDTIEHIADEFRGIYDAIGGTRPYSGLRVAVLNSWGALRSWQTFMVAHALWYQQIYSYLGILECLSGAAVDVSFLSFSEVAEHGVPQGIDVIINAGDAGTAFSGGESWLDGRLLTAVRRFVHAGGGLVGIGQPSAVQHGGRYLQLADVLGVEQELGFTLSTDKYYKTALPTHFITLDCAEPPDYGEGMKNMYATAAATQVIDYRGGSVLLAANEYGAGRGVYMAGLPYSPANARLLLRALFYAAHKEQALAVWFADNPACEVHAYPETGRYAVLNNTQAPQETRVYDGAGNSRTVALSPAEIRWETI